MDRTRQSDQEEKGVTAISELLAHVRVADATTFHNLSVVPLMDGAAGEPDYLTLDEALALGTAHITEVSSGGSVPELKFSNEGSQRVLLLDGEELVGAKQNRVLNLSILVPARTTLVIPVSCVEAGRWSSRSAEFSASPRTLFAASRAKKMARVSESLRLSGERHSNQGEVWADIDDKMRRMAAQSPTNAMAAMFEQHAAGLEEYTAAFSAADRQVGAVFAINGHMVGCDLFDHPATLRKLFPKLVRSYSLDALDAAAAKPTVPSRPSAAEFLQGVGQAQAEVFPAIGEGEDVRLTGERLTGAVLVATGRVIHLSAFRIEEEGQANPASARARMSRASQRRRYQQGETGGSQPIE